MIRRTAKAGAVIAGGLLVVTLLGVHRAIWR